MATKPDRMKITIDTAFGRIMLALRAGPHEPGQLSDRFTGWSSFTGKLVKRGLVELSGGAYRLTDAGRAACPSRIKASKESRCA